MDTEQSNVRLQVGDIALTRVSYFDIALDPEVVGITAEHVRSITWGVPAWATVDGKVLIGQAVWVVESAGHVIVVDPCGAADDFLRAGADAIAHQEKVRSAMADAGLPAERVDRVVLTHLDGIGMAAAVADDGGWEPMFPNARVVMTQAELDRLADNPAVPGLEALRSLQHLNLVDAVDDRHEIAPDVHLERTGAHTRGHGVLRVRGPETDAVIIGHLAVSPLHIATGLCPALHDDPEAAARVLDDLVSGAEASGAVLIGPLWPAPGAATIRPGCQVVAARK